MNDDMTQDDRKAWARTLYTRCGMSLQQVAQTVHADQAALRHWVAEGSWDAVRTTLAMSKNTQLKHIYALAEKLQEKMAVADEPSAKDVEQMLKYSAIIKNMDTDNSVYAVIEAAQLFTEWLHHRDLELTKTFTQQFDLFIKHRMSL